MATAYTQARSIDPAFEDALMDSIDKWIERDLRPVVMHHDHNDIWPAQTVRQMQELGLFGATIGEEWGGLGLPATTYARLVARIASFWMAPTGIFNSHLICAMAIEKFGTTAQKARWLPKMATGELRGGLALTEPDAGTDLQALRMQARRHGDGYIINGTKTWISNGINGHVFALLVKTDPDAQPRYKGMSLFIADKPSGAAGPGSAAAAGGVPGREGFRVGKKIDKLGYKAIDSAELVFEDYLIGADQLIGGVEGEGFMQATGGLELGRINVAARGVGLAEGALRLATAYAQVRHTMGKPIAEHQAIQLKLGEMVTRARAARLLTFDAAQAYDRGERCDMEAGMAKYFASEAAVKNAEEAMRIFGGYSYSKEYEIERYYRDALLMCIGEGTNEMQRMIIAKQWVKRNPA
jgi:alkylation response protein AidB-like acyl-CoA dehydrogenase